MLLDAIVLAGGRSSRLGGVPKSQLPWRGSTLLQNTVDAALHAGARRVVVVGPDGGRGLGSQNPRVLGAREDPPFGGPAAAVAAGIRALGGQQPSGAGAGAGDGADAVLVLACDMPGVAAAVAALMGALPILDGPDPSARRGAIMLDSSQMRQPLAAVYGRRALADAVEALRASDSLDGASMRSLISSLDLLEVPDQQGATRDVDTWNDAADFDIELPEDAASRRHRTPHRKESIMSTGDTNAKPERSDAEKAEMTETLERWSASLAAELGIADLDVDIDAVLALAGVAAHSVLRPAAPLTTYLVGYAAGRAAALDEVSAAQATAKASELATELARRHAR